MFWSSLVSWERFRLIFGILRTEKPTLTATDRELKFMIWAKDLDPGGDDTFRIKIWYEDGGNEVLVYDNGFDQAIGGGNIKIHAANNLTLHASGGVATTSGVSLTQPILDAAVTQAIAYWATQGIDSESLGALKQSDVEIASVSH